MSWQRSLSHPHPQSLLSSPHWLGILFQASLRASDSVYFFLCLSEALATGYTSPHSEGWHLPETLPLEDSPSRRLGPQQWGDWPANRETNPRGPRAVLFLSYSFNFIHPLILQVLTECLPCTKNYSMIGFTELNKTLKVSITWSFACGEDRKKKKAHLYYKVRKWQIWCRKIKQEEGKECVCGVVTLIRWWGKSSLRKDQHAIPSGVQDTGDSLNN